MLPFLEHIDAQAAHKHDQLLGATDLAQIHRLQGAVQALRELRKFIADAEKLANNGR